MLIYEYLLYYNLKPKAWWNNSLSKQERNSILRILVECGRINYNIGDLYKYSLLVEFEDSYILAFYKPNEKNVIVIEK